MRYVWPLLLTALLVSPVYAQEKSVRVGISYAFSAYVEQDGGSAPLGVCLSVASTGRIGIEGEVAYHRDEAGSLVLNSGTAMLGPRFASSGDEVQPFGHVLFGFRYDSISAGDASNAAFTFELGGGVDIKAGSSTFVRLGADFQMVFDDGEGFQVLRLTAGVAF